MRPSGRGSQPAQRRRRPPAGGRSTGNWPPRRRLRPAKDVRWCSGWPWMPVRNDGQAGPAWGWWEAKWGKERTDAGAGDERCTAAAGSVRADDQLKVRWLFTLTEIGPPARHRGAFLGRSAPPAAPLQGRTPAPLAPPAQGRPVLCPTPHPRASAAHTDAAPSGHPPQFRRAPPPATAVAERQDRPTRTPHSSPHGDPRGLSPRAAASARPLHPHRCQWTVGGQAVVGGRTQHRDAPLARGARPPRPPPQCRSLAAAGGAGPILERMAPRRAAKRAPRVGGWAGGSSGRRARARCRAPPVGVMRGRARRRHPARRAVAARAWPRRPSRVCPCA